MKDTARIGKRGTLVIPAPLRKRLGLEEGDLVVLEEDAEGLELRPAAAVPIEIYSTERKASFLLENAVDDADYLQAREAVRDLGLDPDQIDHQKP